MKTVRFFSITMAVIMLVAVLVPFAATPAEAQANTTTLTTSPTQSFFDAMRSFPLLAPMSISAPSISMSIESAKGSGYACSLVSQTPKDWVRMKSRQSFDMTWTVQNTGTTIWHTGSTTLAYVSGTKMQTLGNSFDISADVGRGGKTSLAIDMTAPKALGTYSTLWALTTGKTKFCRVTFVLTVIR